MVAGDEEASVTHSHTPSVVGSVLAVTLNDDVLKSLSRKKLARVSEKGEEEGWAKEWVSERE